MEHVEKLIEICEDEIEESSTHGTEIGVGTAASHFEEKEGKRFSIDRLQGLLLYLRIRAYTALSIHLDLYTGNGLHCFNV